MGRSFRFRISVVALIVVLVVGLAPVGGPSQTAVAQASPSPYVPAGLFEVERGSRTLIEIANGFPAPAEAAALLRAWGWSTNAYFDYAGETVNGTTSLEVSLHLLGDPASATEAMSYFAAGRTLQLGMSPVPIGRIGDQVLAIGGRRDGVNEVTIYLRICAFLVRISAVAPFGDPMPDAEATPVEFLRQVHAAGSGSRAQTVEDLLPTLAYLPAGFIVSDEGYRDQGDIAGTFLRPVEADGVLTASGFQENVYRYFARNSAYSPYPGAATSFEVSLHLFGSAGGAADALSYYADGRSEAIGIRVAGFYDIGDGAYVLLGAAPGGGIESTVYLLVGNVLARVSAVAPDGDPTADALAIAFVIASVG